MFEEVFLSTLQVNPRSSLSLVSVQARIRAPTELS